jgi:hypothetical protein
VETFVVSGGGGDGGDDDDDKTTKNTFLIDIAVPKTHNLAKIITEKQQKYRELANENKCYVEAKYSTSDPDSNIYGSNNKVTIAKSKET